jgi:GNAT superfamily N-acetyltransferase
VIPPCNPAGHAGRILAHTDETDADALSQVIAEAFFDLPPSRWLVEDPANRRAIFPGYFLLYVEHTLAYGLVQTTPERDAVALWLPAGPGAPNPRDGYSTRLAATTGSLVARFEAFDAALEARHPVALPHQHLAILAVRPGRQGHGIGTTLLTARHATLDAEGIPAFLEASSPDSRRLYLRHGYADYGPRIDLPDGPTLYPMWRRPRDTHRAVDHDLRRQQ